MLTNSCVVVCVWQIPVSKLHSHGKGGISKQEIDLRRVLLGDISESSNECINWRLNGGDD